MNHPRWLVLIALLACLAVGYRVARRSSAAPATFPSQAPEAQIALVPQTPAPPSPPPVSSGDLPSPYRAMREAIHAYDIDETRGNEMLDELAARDFDWLAGDLVKIIGDERHTPRWRNYCVQHLTNHYIRHRDAASREGLMAAARSDTPLVREVGVFSLARAANTLKLSPDDPFRRDALDALHGALGPENPPNTRVAAVRAIGLLGLAEFTPELEQAAANLGSPIQLRVAAVDALGTLRSAESARLLADLSASESPNLRAAAGRALARVKPSETGR